MKIRTVLLASAMLAAATGAVFAQGTGMSGPSGNSMSNGSVTTPQQTPTQGSANQQTQQKNKSPGATDSSIKQEK
jgi:hypothetical protein